MYNENIKSLFKTFGNKWRLWRRLATYKNARNVGWRWVKIWTHCSLIKHQPTPSNIAQQDLKHNRRHWTWIIDQLGLTCRVCYITSLRESSAIWASEASLPRTRERRAKERRALLSSTPRGFAARSRVLARLVSLAQIAELAGRLLYYYWLLPKQVDRDTRDGWFCGQALTTKVTWLCLSNLGISSAKSSKGVLCQTKGTTFCVQVSLWQFFPVAAWLPGLNNFDAPRQSWGRNVIRGGVHLFNLIDKQSHVRDISRTGSLSNDDGDGNENDKKAIGLDWQTNNTVRASRFLVHFFAVAARLQRESA